MKFINALDEWGNSSSPKCPLSSGMISRLCDMECSDDKKERRERMIEHGDVDADYFNR